METWFDVDREHYVVFDVFKHQIVNVYFHVV